MSRTIVIAAVLASGAAAHAAPVLQFDVNGFNAQAVNSSSVNSPFGGVSHTGAVQFTAGTGTLGGLFTQMVAAGPFTNAGFAGFTMTSFTGQVNLSGGAVTGGSITITLNNADSYTCNIAPGSGAVSNYVGGGFKIEALTVGGFLSDSVFGNVNVTPWYSAQGSGGLNGSFLQFNFNPGSNGLASSDMDIFVDVVPLPSAAWAGMATLAGIVAVRRLRR